MRKRRAIRFCGKKYCFPDFFWFRDAIRKQQLITDKDRIGLLSYLHFVHRECRDLYDEKNYWCDKFFETKHNCTKYGNIDIREYYPENVKNKKPTLLYRLLVWLYNYLE